MTACRISCEEWSPRSPSLHRPSLHRAQFLRTGRVSRHSPDLKLTLDFRIERVGTPREVHNDASAGIWLRYLHRAALWLRLVAFTRQTIPLQTGSRIGSNLGSRWVRHVPRFVSFNPYSARSASTSASILPMAQRWAGAISICPVDPTGGFVFTPGPPTAQMGLANVDFNLRMPYTEQIESHCGAPIALERCFASILYLYRQSRYRLLFYNWRNRSNFPSQPSPRFTRVWPCFPASPSTRSIQTCSTRIRRPV
jgi:hypothetical protein